MEIREYVEVLRKNWLLIIAMGLVGLAAGAGISLVMPPEYESRTQIYVSTRSDTEDPWELLQGADYSRQVVNSYVDVINTGLVLDPVVAELGLEMSAAELSEHVLASSPLDSALIDIRAFSPSAEQAAQIANAVGESFKAAVQTELEPAYGDGASLVTLTTTQKALVPGSPERPNLFLNLALGLMLGLAVGYAIALFRRLLDTRIHTAEELEAITTAPVLGTIVDDADLEKHRVIVESKPQSPRAESFRSLRTSLQFLNVDSRNRSYVITSANQGEGKSTTALNLAAVLAQAGSRVIVVDSDLRLPMIADYLGIEGGAGLTDVLIGTAELTDVVQKWGQTEFYVLPAGRIPPNPSELLGSDEMARLLETLHDSYDYVIFDAPPARTVTDATVLGKLVSGVLLVVAAGKTTKPELESTLRGLETTGIDLLGVIVTHLPPGELDNYYYTQYSSAAEEEEERKKRGRVKGTHAK